MNINRLAADASIVRDQCRRYSQKKDHKVILQWSTLYIRGSGHLVNAVVRKFNSSGNSHDSSTGISKNHKFLYVATKEADQILW